MSVTSADAHKAMIAVWNASTLTAIFKGYWDVGNQSEFAVLHDQQASAAQPFPYCVFNQDAGDTINRMSGHSSHSAQRMETREIPWEFRVHARAFRGISKTAKQIAAELAEEILKVYGGHPEVEPVLPTLDYGNVMQINYKTDWGIREGDQEYAWYIQYGLLLDVPVAA